MSKFIEVTAPDWGVNGKVVINTDHIKLVYDHEDCRIINFINGNNLGVTESYQDICDALRLAGR